MNFKRFGILIITLAVVFESINLCILSTVPDHPEPAPVLREETETSKRIRDAVNRERSKQNLNALEYHASLMAAAEGQAADMASRDMVDHFGRNGSTWYDRCREAGYPGASPATIGENAAGWQTSPEQAVSDWMQSPGHRAAILGDYQYCGSGVGVSSSNRNYYCTDFGKIIQ